VLISLPYGGHVVAIHPVMRTRLVFPIEWMTSKWKLLLVNCAINLTLSNESGHLINQNEYGQWLTRVCFVLIGSITQVLVRLLQLARTFKPRLHERFLSRAGDAIFFRFCHVACAPGWLHLWQILAINWRPRESHTSRGLGTINRHSYLRWLPTVLTVCTPERGWRTKNELLVSPLGLSSWRSQGRLVTHLGFLFN